MMNPLLSLHAAGQSVWLDELSRELLTGGELRRLIAHDGVRGVVATPASLARALADGGAYREILEAPESRRFGAEALYERIVIRDVQDAADLLRPAYLEARRRDGFVCLAVSPERAHDTAGTVEEARRLWSGVRRENLLLDIPATPAGIEALPQLLGESINVRVSLLFAQETYGQVAEAHLEGIERLNRKGGDLDKVASVASFTPESIDVAMDERIGERLRASQNPDEQAWLRSLVGKVANAAAKRTYRTYLELLRGDRWQELSRSGAQPQRLLWSGAARQHDAARERFYIEEFVGADTVTAVSAATLNAFRDHGRVRASLTEGIEEATSLLDLVEYVGLPGREIAEHLQGVALKRRTDDFDQLLRVVDRDGGASDRDPTTLLRIKMFKELYEGRAHS